MRILLTTDMIGGVWTFTRELTEQLLARGHHVALVSFGRMPSSEQERWSGALMKVSYGRFMYFGSAVPLEWMQQNESCFAQGEEVLAEIAREFKPDLVHANQFCWGGSVALALPKLITAHSDILSWASACRSEALPASDWLERYCGLVQRGLDGAAAVVAPTRWMASAMAKHFDAGTDVRIIPNGRTLGPSCREVPRRLQAVSVGRLWDEAKGMQTLLDVDSPLPMLVAGEDSFEGTKRSTGRLRALGLLEEPEMLQVFYESSVYIASSVYEPFGLAPLEAALCGCAVAARDIESFREVWGEGALYFRDAADLACMLKHLASDEDALRSARSRSGIRARRYTAEAMVDSYMELYQELTSGCKDASTCAKESSVYAA